MDFLLAPFGSGHTKVVAGVAERYGVPVMATSASSDSIFNQGYKYLFGTLAPNSGSVENLITVITKNMPNAKRIAILGREDVFPKAMATVINRRRAMAMAIRATAMATLAIRATAMATLATATAIPAMATR